MGTKGLQEGEEEEVVAGWGGRSNDDDFLIGPSAYKLRATVSDSS